MPNNTPSQNCLQSGAASPDSSQRRTWKREAVASASAGMCNITACDQVTIPGIKSRSAAAQPASAAIQRRIHAAV